MKIAIISDTHDNVANIKKVINWLNKEEVKILLHCGDIATSETLKEGFVDFKGEIHISLGNADIRHDLEPGKYGNCDVLSGFGKINLDKKRIAFVHFPEEAKDLAEGNKYDLVFYGHTHKPWEEKMGNCRLVNPGEAAGQFYKPTFAVYDTGSDKLELKIIERLV